MSTPFHDAIECSICLCPMQGAVVLCSSCTQSICLKCSGFALTSCGDIDTAGGKGLADCPLCHKINWQPLRNRAFESTVQKLMQSESKSPAVAAVAPVAVPVSVATSSDERPKCPACKAILGDEEEQFFHMTEACPVLENVSKPCPTGCTKPAILYSPHKLKLHLQDECPQQPCPCPHADACGVILTQRKLLAHHLDGHCEAKLVPCSATVALNRLLPPDKALRVTPGLDTLSTSFQVKIPALLDNLDLPRLGFSTPRNILGPFASVSDPFSEDERFEAGCPANTAYYTECILHHFPGGESTTRDARTAKMHVAYLSGIRMLVLWFPILGLLRVRRCDSTCSDTQHAWRVSAVGTTGPWRMAHNVSFVPSLWVEAADAIASSSKKSGKDSKESKTKTKMTMDSEALRIQVPDRPDAFADDSKSPWCVRISLLFMEPGMKQAVRTKFVAEQLTRMHQQCRSSLAAPVAQFRSRPDEPSAAVAAVPAASSSSSGVKRLRDDDAEMVDAQPAGKRIKLVDKIEIE